MGVVRAQTADRRVAFCLLGASIVAALERQLGRQGAERERYGADPISWVPRAFPVVASRSRQAHQALKSLATHKTDRNDARGCENAPATLAYGHVVVGPGRTRLAEVTGCGSP